jgi:hypothetical protein
MWPSATTAAHASAAADAQSIGPARPGQATTALPRSHHRHGGAAAAARDALDLLAGPACSVVWLSGGRRREGGWVREEESGGGVKTVEPVLVPAACRTQLRTVERNAIFPLVRADIRPFSLLFISVSAGTRVRTTAVDGLTVSEPSVGASCWDFCFFFFLIWWFDLVSL